MAFRKIVGFALLILGLLIIFWGLYSSYNIFTAKTEVPEIFKVTEKQVPLVERGETQGWQTQIESMVGGMISEQLEGLLPSDFLPKLFNLIAWSIFTGLTIFAGTQIASLGIKLIKE